MPLFVNACVLLLAAAAQAWGAGPDARRFGPAEDPEAWPDWGGTPDIEISPEAGLSPDEIRGILSRFKSADGTERAGAAQELARNAAGSEAAMREVLWGRQGARNAEMKLAIRDAETRAERLGKNGDLLEGLISIDPSDSEKGRGAAGALGILAVLRALDRLDTMAGYKVMIDFSPRHAGVFRQEIGRMLTSHGIEALPALVYGRGSKNEEIHMFAVKWIRDLGELPMGERIKIKNQRRLAQLIEAYASVNELDAIEITLSFTNHDSVVVRNAARRCVEVYGVNAKWAVMRRYENAFGEEPSEDADTGKLLEELYAHFDRQRLSKVNALFADGMEKAKAGKLNEAAANFRSVLRDEPIFPKRSEMAELFLKLSEEMGEKGDSREERRNLLMAYRTADPGSGAAMKAESRLRWLDAEDLRSRGIAVSSFYGEVLKNDPQHKGARKRLAEFSGDSPTASQMASKVPIVAFFVFLASLLIYFRIGSGRLGRKRNEGF